MNKFYYLAKMSEKMSISEYHTGTFGFYVKNEGKNLQRLRSKISSKWDLRLN